MTDLLSASVSLGVKNKREISWKKISQSQTPPCLSLSSNLPSPVVWDLDWILYCADLSAHLLVPAAGTGEHPQSLPDVRVWASWRDFFTVPQLPAHSCVSHGLGFLWISHCFCEIRIFLPRSTNQEWNKLCLCSAGALAALP